MGISMPLPPPPSPASLSDRSENHGKDGSMDLQMLMIYDHVI